MNVYTILNLGANAPRKNKGKIFWEVREWKLNINYNSKFLIGYICDIWQAEVF